MATMSIYIGADHFAMDESHLDQSGQFYETSLVLHTLPCGVYFSLPMVPYHMVPHNNRESEP